MDTDESTESPVPVNQQEEDDRARAAGWPLGSEMRSYYERLNGITTAVKLSMHAISSEEDSVLSETREYVKKRGLKHTDGPGEISVTYGQEDVPAFLRIRQRAQCTKDARILIPRSLFVLMISEHERLLGRLLTATLTLNPEMCNQLEMPPITVKEALGFESIEAMRQRFIESEVDKMMWKSPPEQLDQFTEITGVKDRSRFQGERELYEANERRNLYVHWDGIISRKYLGECSRLLVDLPQNTNKGAVLELTPEYFFARKRDLLVFGLELGIAVWWQVFQKHHDATALFMNDFVLLSLLREDDYQATIALGEYAVSLFSNKVSDDLRGAAVINTAQAYKWSGHEDKCRHMLAKLNWEKSSDFLRLGIAVLQQDYGKAAKYMAKIGANGSVTDINYHEWPLFKEFRNSREFSVAYDSIFGKPFQDVSKVTGSTSAAGPDSSASATCTTSQGEKTDAEESAGSDSL
jgi:hypothetical protein